MVVFSILAGAVLLVLPMLVGGFVEQLGLTAKQAGLLGAADMSGGTAAAFGVSFLVRRGHWRGILASGICLAFVADALSGLVHGFPVLFMLRILAGLGEGIFFTMANAATAETGNPDRVFGLCGVGQLIFASVALYFMPGLLIGSGVRGAFWTLAALTASSILLVQFMPDRARASEASGASAEQRCRSRNSIVGLTALFLYYIAEVGVWAYLERVGVAKQFDAANIGSALAMSSIAGLGGAVLASWLGVRIGRMKPLTASMLCTVASLLVLNGNTGFAIFAAMVALFNFAWNFAVPFEFGALSQIDPSRRTIALASGVSYAGVTLGPVVAAAMISGTDFQGVTWMGIILSISSFLLFRAVL
jgi:predicted MFS family arabinose efflux permease